MMKKPNKNTELLTRALQAIPGGVNSPVRSFTSIARHAEPFFTTAAKDCYLSDVAGNSYIDYVCSWGANIVGHANTHVVDKLSTALTQGISFGTASVLEVEFAEQIKRLMPSIEKLRLVNSGTEAVMSAIRLARGYRQKPYIIKFAGCYHGHSDNLLVKAGSGVATFAREQQSASSNGVLAGAIKHTIVIEYNDVGTLKTVFNNHKAELAAVIIEPFAGNMNLVRPTNEFLTTLVSLCHDENCLLIFDEVMTGFRVNLGGAQELFNLKPDLTILGKVIGGGLPLAAFGGKKEIMDHLAPVGDIYQAGTLSGNPIAVSAGLATLDLITQPSFYNNLSKLTARLSNGLTQMAKKHSLDFCADSIGGMFGFYFCKTLPTNLVEVQKANIDYFKRFFQLMLAAGVFFAPSMFEAGFVCDKHTQEIIDKTIVSADDVFSLLRT